jgi:hypothetical protein
MRKLLFKVWALGAIWGLLTLSSLGSSVALPECTFESCPVCLPEGMAMVNKSKNLNIVIQKETHSLPLRIGRCLEYWDTQALLAQFTGILAKEKLGINVEYIHADDESQFFRALSNCHDWEADGTCKKVVRGSAEAVAAKNASKKHYADVAPDIMWAPEFIATSFCGLSSCTEEELAKTDIVWLARQTVTTGGAGFVSPAFIYV